MLSGASVDVLCEHNALVSEAAKRSQVAEAWVRTKKGLSNLEDQNFRRA